MNIHEYQAKAILRQFGAPVPAGHAAFSVAEAQSAAASLPGPPFVVKAQIHAGGRGKGSFLDAGKGGKGGVRVCQTVDAAREAASAMLGHTLVTHQTGAPGRLVRRLYVEQGAAIARELYLSLILDRTSARLTFVASTSGGMDIEEVAHTTPERVATIGVDPATGYMPHHGRRIAKALALSGDLAKEAAALGAALYRAYLEKDMTLLEVNPLIVTADGHLLCLDAKISFDDSALFRQPEIVALRDQGEEDAKEIEASRYELSYVALDGTIGCMVNGAGLAMATMDIIKLYGAEPANFLDVGGGASKEKVTAAFKIITSDERVKGILVNIFGGIMRCDTIAEGVIAAVKEIGLKVPLVVRLEGTNVELGKQILGQSGLAVIAADDLDDAAQKIVAAVDGRREG